MTVDLDKYFEETAKVMGLEKLQDKFEKDYLISRGVRLHLNIIRHSADAPTVVFVPGMALYSLCYAELLGNVAAEGFNVIGFDPRGQGQSGGKRGDFDFNDIVKDTQAVVTYAIDNFNPEITVMGSRQGGIAALYAAAADDRICSAVCHSVADLADTKDLNVYPTFTKLLKPFAFGLSRIFPNISLKVKRHFNVPNEELKHFGDINAFMQEDPLVLKRIKVKSLRSFNNARLARPLDNITTPIFVLQPEKDSIFPLEYTQKIVNKLAGKTRLEIFEGKSATMITESVAEVLPSITRWLKEIHPSKDTQLSKAV